MRGLTRDHGPGGQGGTWWPPRCRVSSVSEKSRKASARPRSVPLAAPSRHPWRGFAPPALTSCSRKASGSGPSGNGEPRPQPAFPREQPGLPQPTPPPPPRCTGPPSTWQERECALGAGSRERAPVKNGLGEGFCSCLIPSLEGKFPPPRPHPMCAICVTLNGMQIWSLPIRPLEASQLQRTLANIQTAIVWDSLPLS